VRLASRMERIGTETAFEAAARARALEATGREVIHLEIGEPDFDTPRHISEAAAAGLLDEGMTHYTAATGILPLREAIVDDVRRRKGITATPEQVIVTPGAKPIMFYAMLALVDDGDEVSYPNPGFPIYESMARYAGGTPVAAPLREENDFRMDVDEVASLVTDRTRLIVINSPHNPTGSILAADDIREIARIAVERDIVVLCSMTGSSRTPRTGRARGASSRLVMWRGSTASASSTGTPLGRAARRPRARCSICPRRRAARRGSSPTSLAHRSRSSAMHLPGTRYAAGGPLPTASRSPTCARVR